MTLACANGRATRDVSGQRKDGQWHPANVCRESASPRTVSRICYFDGKCQNSGEDDEGILDYLTLQVIKFYSRSWDFPVLAIY